MQSESWTVAQLTETAHSCDFCSFLLRIARTDPKFAPLNSQEEFTLFAAEIGQVRRTPRSLEPYKYYKLFFCPRSSNFAPREWASIIPYIPPSYYPKQPAFFQGRRVEEVVNLTFLKSWLKRCSESDHHQNCQPDIWIERPKGAIPVGGCQTPVRYECLSVVQICRAELCLGQCEATTAGEWYI